MSHYCKIPDCPNELNQVVFKIPRRKEMREQWLKIIHNAYPNLRIGKSFTVCDKHFKPSNINAYVTDECGKIITQLPSVKRVRLKRNAVPYFAVQRISASDSTAMPVVQHEPQPKSSGISRSHRVYTKASKATVSKTDLPITSDEVMETTIEYIKPELVEIKQEIIEDMEANADQLEVKLKTEPSDYAYDEELYEPQNVDGCDRVPLDKIKMEGFN